MNRPHTEKGHWFHITVVMVYTIHHISNLLTHVFTHSFHALHTLDSHTSHIVKPASFVAFNNLGYGKLCSVHVAKICLCQAISLLLPQNTYQIVTKSSQTLPNKQNLTKPYQNLTNPNKPHQNLTKTYQTFQTL